MLFVLSYFSCINKVIQRILLHLKLKKFFLGLGLAVIVFGTEGVLPHSKRRFAPAMGQDPHSNGKIIIELFLSYIASSCVILL